jgi:hypothetical protein
VFFHHNLFSSYCGLSCSMCTLLVTLPSSLSMSMHPPSRVHSRSILSSLSCFSFFRTLGRSHSLFLSPYSSSFSLSCQRTIDFQQNSSFIRTSPPAKQAEISFFNIVMIPMSGNGHENTQPYKEKVRSLSHGEENSVETIAGDSS